MILLLVLQKHCKNFRGKHKNKEQKKHYFYLFPVWLRTFIQCAIFLRFRLSSEVKLRAQKIKCVKLNLSRPEFHVNIFLVAKLWQALNGRDLTRNPGAEKNPVQILINIAEQTWISNSRICMDVLNKPFLNNKYQISMYQIQVLGVTWENQKKRGGWKYFTLFRSDLCKKGFLLIVSERVLCNNGF